MIERRDNQTPIIVALFEIKGVVYTNLFLYYRRTICRVEKGIKETYDGVLPCILFWSYAARVATNNDIILATTYW